MQSQILSNYTQAYNALYHRSPSEITDLGNGWVLVNGARMSTEELELLTKQLQLELEKVRAKRSVVKRLLKWFSTPQPGA